MGCWDQEIANERSKPGVIEEIRFLDTTRKDISDEWKRTRKEQDMVNSESDKS